MSSLFVRPVESQPANIGNALLQAAQINSYREQGEYRNALMDKAQQEMALERRKLDQAEARRTQFGGLIPRAVGGDTTARNQAFALDPEMATKVFDGISKANESQRKEIEWRAEQAGRLFNFVQGVPDAQKPNAYKAARAEAIRLGLFPADDQSVPTEYDPQFVSQRLAMASTVKDALDRTKPPEGMHYVDGRLANIPGYVESKGAVSAATREPQVTWKTVTDADGKTYQVSSRGERKDSPGAGGGLFSGTALDAQAMNLLLDPKADPASPQYLAAYNHLNQPKQTLDPSTGQLVTIRPDMSAYRPPVKAAQPAPAPAAPPGAPPAANALQPAPAPANALQPQQVAPGVTVTPVGPAKLSAQQEKELFETDDIIRTSRSTAKSIEDAIRLNASASSGALAGVENAYNRTLGNPVAAADTTEFNSIVTGQALESMRAIFGANPTEGERKILMDMQAAPNMRKEERARLLTRAKAAIEAREQAARVKAQQIRSGNFTKPQEGGAGNPDEAARLLQKYGVD